jgi:hypothetical protein
MAAMSDSPAGADPPRADPVRVRRARIARFAKIGQRVGYLLFALAAVAFFVGSAMQFPGGLVTLIEVCLLVGSAFLAPSIVLGYAVKAAERDDQERGR